MSTEAPSTSTGTHYSLVLLKRSMSLSASRTSSKMRPRLGRSSFVLWLLAIIASSTTWTSMCILCEATNGMNTMMRYTSRSRTATEQSSRSRSRFLSANRIKQSTVPSQSSSRTLCPSSCQSSASAKSPISPASNSCKISTTCK